MPITIQPATLKVKKQNGQYQSADCLKGDKGDPGSVGIIAPDYADLTFPVAQGQPCIHEGLYYIANSAIQSSESWTAAHWTQLTVGEQVTDVLNAIHGMNTATASDVGKALSPKTVADGEVTEWKFVSVGGGGGVEDVKVNDVSVVSQGVASIPVLNSSTLGVAKVAASYGIDANNEGRLAINKATDEQVKEGTHQYRPVTPYNQHISAFYAFAKAAGDTTQQSSNNNVGIYTETAKSKIHDMIDAPENVSGSTPSITAKSGVRYICGECSTLSIVAPESGIIDVIFESGTTATVLTVTSAKSGVSAIKWANGFDPTNLEANTFYELNIMDGEYGVVASWT